MFDSAERMAKDAVKMLEVLLEIGDGRYACVVDRKHGVVLETTEPDPALKHHFDEKREAIFALPDVMANGDAEADDQLFEGFADDFLVAVLNGRAAIVVACQAAEAIQVERKALEALTDRLLRLDSTWRLDPAGRGLFAGRPRLDIVIAGSSEF
jgi:hypothetical protein